MSSINEIKQSIPDYYSEQEKEEIIKLLIDLAELYIECGVLEGS